MALYQEPQEYEGRGTQLNGAPMGMGQPQRRRFRNRQINAAVTGVDEQDQPIIDLPSSASNWGNYNPGQQSPFPHQQQQWPQPPSGLNGYGMGMPRQTARFNPQGFGQPKNKDQFNSTTPYSDQFGQPKNQPTKPNLPMLGQQNAQSIIASILGSHGIVDGDQPPIGNRSNQPPLGQSNSSLGLTRGEGWQAGGGSAMAGWDPAKWGNPDEMGAKYIIGEILGRYNPTREGITAAMEDPDFKRFFPNARLIGHGDKIDFGDTPSDFVRGGPPVGVVDVIGNYDENTGVGTNWWYGNDPGLTHQYGNQNPMMPANSAYAQVQQAIGGQQSEDGESNDPNNILQMLQLLLGNQSTNQFNQGYM